MKLFVISLICLSSISTFAGVGGALAAFGGARSISSGARASSFSSSARSSSFGGARATSGSVTITRPSYSAPTTTVIHSSDHSGSGFVNGMLMGTMLSQPHMAVMPGTVAPVVVTQQHSVMSELFSVVVFIAVALGLIYLVKLLLSSL